MTDLEQIEVLIENSKEIITKADRLERLYQNSDFQQAILQDYFKDHVARLIRLKASISMQGDRDQAYIEGQIMAVGHMQEYITSLAKEADTARSNLVSAENEREALLNEEVN